MIRRLYGDSDFKAMSVSELWALYETTTVELEKRMLTEQKVLEVRLASLTYPPEKQYSASKTGRRPYPTVLPKFRNPDDPTQTWAGRGKQPRWFTKQLKSGRPLDDLRIRIAAE